MTRTARGATAVAIGATVSLLAAACAGQGTGGQGGGGGVFAFTTRAMIPALVSFLAMQERIVDGLQGAVKG